MIYWLKRHGDRNPGLFFMVSSTHQLRVPIRKCVDDLELIAKAAEPEDLINQLIFFPL